jgi:hypothetical protein
MRLEAKPGAYEDLQAVQACRVYVNSQSELVQEIFGMDYQNSGTSWRNVLARGVAGVYFRFDQENRLLTMYLAARGQETGDIPGKGVPSSWPPEAPGFSNDDQERRIIAQSVTWRIRN